MINGVLFLFLEKDVVLLYSIKGVVPYGVVGIMSAKNLVNNFLFA